MTKLGPGQVAVVTGAGSGIGFALASTFAQRGLHTILADRDSAALASAEQRLAGSDGRVVSVCLDVADPVAVIELAQETIGRFGRVDIVCNNAGICEDFTPIWEIDHERWQRVLGVNIGGVINGIRAFVPHLIEQGHGHIVNTGSIAGLSTLPGLADYGGSKHAVVALSETLVADLATVAPGVGVTVICPAMVNTPFGRRARESAARHAGAVSRVVAASGAAMIEPEYVATCTIEAIERNDLYVVPSPGSEDRIHRRLEPLLEAIATQRCDASQPTESQEDS